MSCDDAFSKTDSHLTAATEPQAILDWRNDVTPMTFDLNDWVSASDYQIRGKTQADLDAAAKVEQDLAKLDARSAPWTQEPGRTCSTRSWTSGCRRSWACTWTLPKTRYAAEERLALQQCAEPSAQREERQRMQGEGDGLRLGLLLVHPVEAV